ncbi:putative nuclease HARBI1 [Stegodyphus dumicola]|uniref:putative nuclease HARBI1 n=1 Tax=Stegodyphus dumicola TaxID=202533 RepID=UPI0015B0A2BB|nr:putative nuclease HARBI1 [Stegodyphus dumicola]
MRLAGFPGVIGAIDCTHVKIVAPPRNDSTCPEHIFVNRHCSHSINVQMICDANQKIISCNAKFPGSTHDAFIWRTSAVRRIMQEISSAENTTWLLGDSGYPLEEGLLTPRLDSLENSPDQRYNVALCKTRNVIERCFGVLKSRFRCLLGEKVLHYRPQVAGKIINACVVLHNMCNAHGLPDPALVECEEIPSEIERGTSHARALLIQRFNTN